MCVPGGRALQVKAEIARAGDELSSLVIDTLKDGWLPTCEARTANAQAAGNACLKVEGHALSCGEGLRCETEALRPTNLVGRIGVCVEQP